MRTRRQRRRTQSGFTLIETLVAAGILLIVAVGVLPLFIRAMANNSAGGEMTQKVAFTDSRVDELSALRWTNPLLNWTSPDTRLTTMNFFALGNPKAAVGLDSSRGWQGEALGTMTTDPAPPAGVVLLWTRRTRIRNYNISEFTDAALDYKGAVPSSFPPTPLSGDAHPDTISMKEIVVEIRNGSQRQTGLNGFDVARFTTYKVQ